MAITIRQRWLAPFLGVLIGLCLPGVAFSHEKPAIVLTAFGTSTTAAGTYQYLDGKVKEHFSGYEIRWAFTSLKVRRKVAQEQGQKLNDLPQTLRELKAAGFTRVVVQSLHIVPGEEWEKKVVQEIKQVPGLQVTLGKPLLSSDRDQVRVLAALQKTFPPDLTRTAVVLVGHGSPSPEGEAAYLAFDRLLRSRYPKENVFLGMVQNRPTGEAALAAVKRSEATSVVFIPLLLVAGEHVNRDILGSEPDSWKSQLLAHRAYRIEEIRQGLGYRDGIISIFLDHIHEALQTLSE